MNYEQILHELKIKLIYSDEQLDSPGHYLPNIKTFAPEGLIVLQASLDDQQKEEVILHEIGHKIDGKLLSRLSAPQVHIANEGKANHFMLKHKITEWLGGFDGDYTSATTPRFLEWAQLDPAKFYYMAEDELKEAVRAN